MTTAAFTAHPIIARMSNEPALFAPDSRDLVASLLNQVVAHPKLADLLASNDNVYNDDGYWPSSDSWEACYKPYVVVDGVLQIPVKGVLLHDFAYQLFDWATGYDYVWRAFQRGMADANVLGVALVIDSPGGMVAGCFDACDKMTALKGDGGKPVRAYASESAYSAAYAIACVADTITVSRTGGVGSVGVVTMHVDYSGAMEKAGVNVTFIHAGKHKVDGNAYEPLPDDVRARIQSRIDEMYGIFVDHVAAGRSMTAEAVRATEALCFTASEAKSNGLADEIGTLDDSLAAFAADLSLNEGEDQMSTQDNSAPQTPAEATPVAAVETVDVAAAVATALKADRERRQAITGCAEAKERPALAAHLADNTEMSADDAKGILAVSAVETKPEAATPFTAHMDATEQPAVGAGGSGDNQQDDDVAEAGNVVELCRTLGLKGFAKKAA